MTFLGPEVLIKLIPTFSLIMGAVVLVIFSDTINRYIVFPVADGLKGATRRQFHKHRTVAKYASESVATLIFILYCYLGGVLLAEYVFAPIMYKAKSILILILLGLFLLISYIINVERRRFMKV